MIPKVTNTHLSYTSCDNKPSVQCTKRDLQNNLAIACEEGDVECVQRILEQGVDPNFAYVDGGTTPFITAPLILAAIKGDIEIVRMLCAYGADVNRQDEDGNTALLLATRKGHIKIVEELLARGANIEIQGTDGRTALVWAARNGYTEIVEVLLARRAKRQMKKNDIGDALIWAAGYGHTRSVEVLLDHGADIETKNSDGWTPLLFASRKGHTKSIELLLARGANIEAKDNDGRTALMWTANGDYKGHVESMKALLDARADIEARDNDGRTALMWAANGGYEGPVKVLLHYGACIDAQDDTGTTALIVAVNNHGCLKVVDALLRGTSNIRITNMHGVHCLRALRESSFPGYAEIKRKRELTPKSREYNAFYRVVKHVCHIYSIEGESRFKTDEDDIAFERLGALDGYYSSIFAKNLSLFSANITDKAVLKALSRTQTMLTKHVSSRYVKSDELVKQYIRGTPILVSGGFNGHLAVYCFWNRYCILVNRGSGSRKPIEIFSIKKETHTDPEFLRELLSGIRQIKRTGKEDEFAAFVDDEFQKSCYEQTDVELFLEEMLKLCPQTVGNCVFANTEGTVFALLALEALHAEKGLLSQGECDATKQEKIRGIAKSQWKIFDEFSTFLKTRYRKKYETKVPLKRQEDEILQRLLEVR